jgi:hypothetical protein
MQAPKQPLFSERDEQVKPVVEGQENEQDKPKDIDKMPVKGYESDF